MTNKRWRATTQRELIIEVWEALDCESVGAHELKEIQHALRERFGDGAVASPASIARTVADEGAELRHPEVLDSDFEWRERRLGKNDFSDLNFSNVSQARQSFLRLAETRRASNKPTERDESRRAFLESARENSRLVARSKIIDPRSREEAKEIAHWLEVWLQSPELFMDWLELRVRSADFKKKFKNPNED